MTRRRSTPWILISLGFFTPGAWAQDDTPAKPDAPPAKTEMADEEQEERT